MVHLLLRRGADPNASSTPVPPLLLATRNGNVDIVRELLLARADPLVRLPQPVGYSLRIILNSYLHSIRLASRNMFSIGHKVVVARHLSFR